MFTDKEWKSILGVDVSITNYFQQRKWTVEKNVSTNDYIMYYIHKGMEWFRLNIDVNGIRRGKDYYIEKSEDKKFLNTIIATQGYDLVADFRPYKSSQLDLFFSKLPATKKRGRMSNKEKALLEVPTMKKVKSSNIYAIGYDKVNRTLYIMFGQPEPKSIYSYKNISPQMYKKLIEAKSHGSFFSANIRKNPKKYPYTGLALDKKDLSLIDFEK